LICGFEIDRRGIVGKTATGFWIAGKTALVWLLDGRMRNAMTLLALSKVFGMRV
jgi:hypothetical protein